MTKQIDLSKATPVYGSVKITGENAERLKIEATQRRISLNALISEYALAGMNAPGPDDDALASVEKRLVSTMLGVRADVDEIAANVSVLIAFIDTLSKSLFAHLPEPSTDSRDAIAASALARYEKLIASTAATGFDNQRPRAIQKIVELLADKVKAESDKNPD